MRKPWVRHRNTRFLVRWKTRIITWEKWKVNWFVCRLFQPSHSFLWEGFKDLEQPLSQFGFVQRVPKIKACALFSLIFLLSGLWRNQELHEVWSLLSVWEPVKRSATGTRRDGLGRAERVSPNSSSWNQMLPWLYFVFPNLIFFFSSNSSGSLFSSYVGF